MVVDLLRPFQVLGHRLHQVVVHQDLAPLGLLDDGLFGLHQISALALARLGLPSPLLLEGAYGVLVYDKPPLLLGIVDAILSTRVLEGVVGAVFQLAILFVF